MGVSIVNFLRKKVVTITIIIMSILCIAALYIAFKVSLVMFQKSNQIIRGYIRQENLKDMFHESKETTGRLFDPARFSRGEIYFNGRKIEKLNCYLADNKEFFIPLDLILNETSTKFVYYHPDDILETNINGQKLVLKLWDNTYSIDNRKIRLAMPPVTYDNHIIVPSGLFKYLKSYSIDIVVDTETIFLDYFPD